MRASDYARSVRHTFSSNRGRAALTLLGIMIGAGSIVLLAGLLRGGQDALVGSEQSASERDIVRVSPDEPPLKDRRKTRRELSLKDEDALEESRLIGNAPVTALTFRQARAIHQDRKKMVTLNGITPTTLNLYRLVVEKGRFFTDEDIVERRRVCILGNEVWDELLSRKQILDGADVEIDGHLWQVVGVLKRKPPIGGNFGTWTWDRRILVPNTTFDSVYAGKGHVGAVFVRAGAGGPVGERMAAIKDVVSGTLMRRHLGVKNFRVDGGEGQKNNMEVILMVIKVLLLGTGLLSLFVGGINIMNIMLVTVTERTREIGVRRAVGAPPRAILTQFLLEAALIALTGGIIGVLGGVGLTWAAVTGLRHAFGDWPMHIEMWSVALGLGLSAVTGIVFGFVPAWRAARLDPVEALRYE